MIRKCTLFFVLSLFSLTTLSAPAHGDVRESGDGIKVWHMSVSGWITPEEFFSIEIKRLEGPTYGTVGDYPPYEDVQEWDTLIDRLPDGRAGGYLSRLKAYGREGEPCGRCETELRRSVVRQRSTFWCPRCQTP